MRIALTIALTLVTVAVTAASGHEDTDHLGKTTKFDPYCCNHHDCQRTEDEDLVERHDGVLHAPSGKVFPPSTHRPTSNSRQYVCIWNGQARCLYRRYGT